MRGRYVPATPTTIHEWGKRMGNELGQLQRWSTDLVPATQRREYFQAATESAIIPFQFETPYSPDLSAKIEALALGPVTVMHVAGSPHIARSTAVEISRQRARCLNLVLSRNVPWNLGYQSRVSMRPMDSFITDSQQALSLDIAFDYDFVNIGFDPQWLSEWVPQTGAVVGRQFGADSRWAVALNTFIAALQPTAILNAPLPPRLIVDQLGALILLASSGPDQVATHKHEISKPLNERILDCIRSRCTESTLIAPQVAADLGISVRSLHRALAAQNETFGFLLMKARIDIAVRQLSSPAFNRLTVAAIGRRCGFTDDSHFTRVFRRHVGVTPLALRRARLA